MSDLKERKPLLYSTGLRCLDAVLGGGFAPAEVVVIAASTSHGKTMVGLQLCWEMAAIGGNVLIVSEEMTPKALAERAIETSTDTHQRYWSEDDGWSKVFDDVCAWEEDHPGKIMVPSVPCHSVAKMLDTVGQAVVHFGVKAVMIDYLQLISAPGANRYEQVTNVSIAAKQIATEFGVSVLALAQLNKQADTEPTPKIWHIADSSQIAKDADIVLLCKWPFRADPNYKPEDEYWIACAKNRNRGIREQGAVKVKIEPARQRLLEYGVESKPNYEPAFSQDRF